MQKIDSEILWGTDDGRAKGGDYFKAKDSPRGSGSHETQFQENGSPLRILVR